MAAPACLPLPSSTAPLVSKKFNPRTSIPISRKKWNQKPMTCRAAAPSSSTIDFDLYDLLGIDSSCDQSQIKNAYRTLQKRCHPDIAGPAGHDMAIILNEAYSLLSNPSSRIAYDKEQAKISELRGYTGKPLYSAWFGSENEQRAVFVDEVKCVGCLKCALFAEKTFAVESVYGRARVVAQWADPEDKIHAAIDSCPVDCISKKDNLIGDGGVVERSDLAALEFLMSKQPRGNVRVGASNAAGARVSNIFIDVKKFQTRFADSMKKSCPGSSKETDLQREARMSAIHAIRSIRNWMYWQSPKAETESQQNLTKVASRPIEPNINKLREAAAARKLGTRNRKPSVRNLMYHDDYWIPTAHALPSSTSSSESRVAPEASQRKQLKEKKKDHPRPAETQERNPITSAIPMATGMIAAVIISFNVGGGTVGGLNEHIGGSLALEVINSPWLQICSAGIMWYIVGMVVMQVAEAIQNRFY